MALRLNELPNTIGPGHFRLLPGRRHELWPLIWECMDDSKTQFSLSATLVVTAAFSVWFWFLAQLPGSQEPGELALAIAVFTGVALAAGVAGHVVYSLWLPWRVTVIVTSLLLFNVVFFLLNIFAGSLDLADASALLFEILLLPARELVAMNWISMSLKCLLPTLILTPAHSIRPSIPSAIITALGVVAWYVTGLSIVSSAG